MSYVKRLWKRGMRRQTSFDIKNRQHLHQQVESSSPALLSPSGADPAPRTPLAPGSEASTARLQQEDRAQQEALVGALQTTVLEQSRKIKDLSQTIARMHGESRHVAHHVEALQRLLAQVAGCDADGSGSGGVRPDEMRGGGGGMNGSNWTSHGARMLAPTPMPMSNYVTAREAAAAAAAEAAKPKATTITTTDSEAAAAETSTNTGLGIAAPTNEGEEQGLYSYISGFLPSSLIPFYPIDNAPAAASASSSPSSPSSSFNDLYSLAVHSSAPFTGDAINKSSTNSLDDAQSLLMGQILEKLHLTEDQYAFQAEELHAFQRQVGMLEEELVALREEKQRHDRLLVGLKRELAAYKSKLRARDYKEATMEVEIDRYRHEKQSIT
eukprot:evm.model.NODE_38462_length_11801_cov_16.752394.1